MSTAKLSIPKQEVKCELGINPTTEGVRQWLDSLPAADVEKSTLMVLRLLMAANRCELEVKFRIHLMRNLAPLVDHLVGALRSKYNTGESPYSSSKNVKRVEAVKTLLYEMGHGFKISITKLYNCSDSSGKELLSYSIFQVTRINACRLVESYLLYEPVAAGVWGELSVLYRFAFKRDVHQDRHIFSKIESSTETIYMQLLLLAAINPYRLMRGEAKKVFDLMGPWSHHAKLERPPENWQPGKSELVVNIESGEPPYLVAADSQPDNVSELRIINVSAVKQHLDESASEDQQEGKRYVAKELNVRLQQDMMQRLIGGWTSGVDRDNARFFCDESLELVLGIKNSHSLFVLERSETEERSLDDFGLIPIELQWGTAPRPESGPSGSVFKIDDPIHDIWQDKNTKVGSDDIDDESEGDRLDSYPVKQVDVSDGGFRVEFELSSKLLAKVGDLACVRRAIDGAPWLLCDVRWQQAMSKSHGSMGLRLLSEHPSAFTCKALEGFGSGAAEQIVILIHGKYLSDSGAQLLVPATLYDVGTLLLIMGDQEQRSKVVLTEKLETTSSFANFKFKLR